MGMVELDYQLADWTFEKVCMADLKHPVWRRFSQSFKGERSWIGQVIAASLVGLIIAIRTVIKMRDQLSLSNATLVLVALPAMFLLAAMTLVRADVVNRRLREQKPVGLFSRLVFGAGIWSLLAWIIALLLVGFPLASWLGSVTAGPMHL